MKTFFFFFLSIRGGKKKEIYDILLTFTWTDVQHHFFSYLFAIIEIVLFGTAGILSLLLIGNLLSSLSYL